MICYLLFIVSNWLYYTAANDLNQAMQNLADSLLVSLILVSHISPINFLFVCIIVFF